MLVLAERFVHHAQLAEHRAHGHDRVDAQVRARAVSGATRHLDLAQDEPLVRDDELQLGGLGDDRRVRPDPSQHLLGVEAGVLLVGDRGDHHVAGEVEVRGSRAAMSAAATLAFMS